MVTVSAKGAAIAVNQKQTDLQTAPDVAFLSDGRFVISWNDGTLSDGQDLNVVARLFDADGSAVTDDFRVNAEIDGRQWSSNIAPLEDGGFAIVYEDVSDIDVQRFTASGTPIGDAIQVNSSRIQSRWDADIVQDGSTAIQVIWQDNDWLVGDDDRSAILARAIAPDGSLAGDEQVVNTATLERQVEPAAGSLADGGLSLIHISEPTRPY